MADFIFPTDSSTGTQPTASKTSNLLLSDGTNIGSSTVASVLALTATTDLVQPWFNLGDTDTAANSVTPDTTKHQIFPIGNDVATWTALNVRADTDYFQAGVGGVNIEGRIYAFAVGLVNSHVAGDTTTGGLTDRVGIYSGVKSDTQGGSSWALNTVNFIEDTFGGASAGAGLKAQIGYELDMNNLARNTDNDFANPYIGIQLTGTSDFTSTMAILVTGSGNNANSNSQWNRGIYFASGNVIKDVAIEDQSNSNVSFRISDGLIKGGGAAVRNMGIDMTNATFSAGSIGLKKGPTSNGIFWTNGSTASVDSCDTSGNRFVGTGAAAVFTDGSNLSPKSDNTTSLGASSNRWTNVWSINGTIQTSDSRMKENIEKLPSMLDVVKDLDPVRFNWQNHDGKNHYGFTAQEVKRVVDKCGLDNFGGHVDSSDYQGIRPDQLIALLWRATQELIVKVDRLESDVNND